MKTNASFIYHFTTLLKIIVQQTCDYIENILANKNNIVLLTLDYIARHYHQNITPNDISKYINVNSSYLSRMFKEKTGHTIITTINSKKIEKAKEYLLYTDMKIYEVATAIGINDLAYFSHFFKKHTGFSPTTFKANYKTSPPI